MVSDNLKVAFLSLALVSLLFLLQGNIGLDLADEGFLWYGTQRTALGEVPLRDFRSYDPGRYYWGAAWFQVFGTGIISLRMSLVVIQFIGLTCGLLSLRRVIRNWWMLIILGVLLVVWMAPLYKVFEATLAIAAVYVALLLGEKPTVLRHFGAGAFVGIAGFFGRNHGLYSFVAFFLLILFVWAKIDRQGLFRRILAWGTGIVVGYSPMLMMFFLIPRFFVSFVENFMVIIRLATLPLPIPWPWLPDIYSWQLGLMHVGHRFSVGIFFLLLPVFYIVVFFNLLLSDRNHARAKTLVIASTFVGAVYLHYAFSRADLTHLAGSIPPLLVGLVALPHSLNLGMRRVLNALLVGSLLVLSFFAVGIAHPYFNKALARPGTYVYVELAGDPLWLEIQTAWIVGSSVVINEQKVQPAEGLLVAPHFPALYPILQRESPLWDIYFIVPETDMRQREMIARLKALNVNWVILADWALDGRDDLRFRNTHRLVWTHFMDEFKKIEPNGLPSNFQLLHRKRVAR